MMRQVLVTLAAYLLSTAGAGAQVQIEDQQFFQSAFVRQAPEDYLQTYVDWEQQRPGFSIYDFEGIDFSVPEDFRLTAQTNMTPSVASTSIASYGSSIPFLQQEASQAAADEQAEQAAIAEALANPLSYLWLGFIQNDVINYTGSTIDALGEKDVVNNTTLIMPVLSIQLTEKWKTVIRRDPGLDRRVR